jgi:hypothetical protein
VQRLIILISAGWLPPYLCSSRRLLHSIGEGRGLVTPRKVAPIPGPRLCRWLEIVISGSVLHAARCAPLRSVKRPARRCGQSPKQRSPAHGQWLWCRLVGRPRRRRALMLAILLVRTLGLHASQRHAGPLPSHLSQAVHRSRCSFGPRTAPPRPVGEAALRPESTMTAPPSAQHTWGTSPEDLPRAG